jgi:O2-independent ubiquinone biosynthesis accessory factor UbiT
MTSTSNMTPPLTPVLFAGMVLTPVPPAVLQPALNAAMAITRRKHPDIFERMEGYGDPVFLVDPIDLPYVFILTPDQQSPKLVIAREHSTEDVDAVIRGPLLALIDMLEGRIDGDAMFFSRDLVIEGDTEVVVALRNAVDGAEINLMEGVMALFGPFSAPVRAAVNTAGKIASRAASDLETLREAMLAPSMRRHDAADAKLRKVTDKVGDLDKRSRRGRKDKS